jgi:cytochrome c-type biogenesis protein
MNVKHTLLKLTKSRQYPPKWSLWFGLAMLTTIAILLTKYLNLFEILEATIGQAENNYQKWGKSQPLSNPWLLLLFAFGGGLLASISPCILAMLPVNLSYIGTLNVKSRQEAFWNATGFVLGVVTILSVFGLFSAVAGAIIVEWRGYINLAVGMLIILMGLSIGGLFHLPLPQFQLALPPVAGTYGVGLTFALVSSPCASPVLFAVLAAAAATGSPIWSVLTMVAYALGYTAVIFATSLFAGLMKFTRQILVNSDAVMRWGGLALIFMGGYYVVSGVLWFC